MIHCSQSNVISFLEQKERKIVTNIVVIFLNLHLFDSSTQFSSIIFSVLFHYSNQIFNGKKECLKSYIWAQIFNNSSNCYNVQSIVWWKIRKYEVTVTKPTWGFLRGFKFNIHHRPLLSTFSVLGTASERMQWTRQSPLLTSQSLQLRTILQWK